MTDAFKIKSIRLVSSWSYNLSKNNDCTICRCSLNTNSLYNQDKLVESKIITGACGHCFHEECINPWVTKNKYCPLCSTKWEVLH